MKHTQILLVEDDADDQLLFIEAIGEIGLSINCVTANNGLEAMIHMKTLIPRPTLIFIDLNMPYMNGLECLKNIKSDYRFRSIPVIVFTTSDNPADRMLTRALGAEMFLTKTDDFELLKAHLLKILQTDFSVGKLDSEC